MGCHFFLQGIFPSQGSNPGLLHCRQILYQPSPRRRSGKESSCGCRRRRKGEFDPGSGRHPPTTTTTAESTVHWVAESDTSEHGGP